MTYSQKPDFTAWWDPTSQPYANMGECIEVSSLQPHLDTPVHSPSTADDKDIWF